MRTITSTCTEPRCDNPIHLKVPDNLPPDLEDEIVVDPGGENGSHVINRDEIEEHGTEITPAMRETLEENESGHTIVEVVGDMVCAHCGSDGGLRNDDDD